MIRVFTKGVEPAGSRFVRPTIEPVGLGEHLERTSGIRETEHTTRARKVRREIGGSIRVGARRRLVRAVRGLQESVWETRKIAATAEDEPA